MKALSTSVVIHVTDLDKALKYYTDILGFTYDFRFGDYVGLVYDNICVHLSGPANPGRKKMPGNAHFCIDCDEIDIYYDLITARGALIDTSLEDRPYGMRDCAVNDPDGNTIVFGKAISGSI